MSNEANEKEVNVEETSPRYVKTLTAFSGMDTHVEVNNMAVGEVQEIRYTENLKNAIFFAERDQEAPIVGEVDVVLFNEEPTLKQAIRKRVGFHDSFKLIWCNEFGVKMTATFVDAVFTKRQAKLSVDDVVMKETYTFEAKDIKYDVELTTPIPAEPIQNAKLTIE
jgi:hypothetical protein